MSEFSRVRTRLVVAGAAFAGIAVAGALAAGAARLDVDESDSVRSPATSTGAPVPAPGRRNPTNGLTTSAADGSDEDDATSPVTIDVPRSERSSAPGLRPDPPLSATPSTTAPPPLADPQEAARAYLIAAESVTGDDEGRRHRRAEPYMAPGNPAITSGLLVSDPPSPGHSRTVQVISLEEQARNEDLGRVAYRVTYQRYLSPTIPATAVLPDGDPLATFIVVERQAAGEWLVRSQTTHLDPVE